MIEKILGIWFRVVAVVVDAAVVVVDVVVVVASQFNARPFGSTCAIHQGSISSMFYEQLLHVQIPKAQKDSLVSSVVLRFWDL
jgi:hypothetical protein